jgi:ribose 5-phosphate isomerase B
MSEIERQFTHIYLATDHAGLEHKNAVAAWLQEEGVSVTDFGAFVSNPDDDFPTYISQAARTVSMYPQQTAAIVFGGSGQGEAMLANRFPRIRAAVYYGGPDEIVTVSRQHNDANVLSIGARFVSIDESKRLIWEWIHTARFEEAKYIRRNQQISHITKQIERT